jgi:hypothetical protein
MSATGSNFTILTPFRIRRVRIGLAAGGPTTEAAEAGRSAIYTRAQVPSNYLMFILLMENLLAGGKCHRLSPQVSFGRLRL